MNSPVLTTPNVDPQELAKFSELAHRWWDPNSEFRPLHQINPLRLEWIDGLAPLRGQRVLDVGEAVLGAHLVRPALDRRALDLDGRTALAADDVVVVAGAAPPVQRLAVVGAQGVQRLLVDHGLQGPVDGRQTDLVAAGDEARVDLLRRAELVAPVDVGLDRRALAAAIEEFGRRERRFGGAGEAA